MGHKARPFSLDDERTIPEPNSGCIIWLGSVTSGYGTVRINTVLMRAHRCSYETFKGPIPEGLYICHTCDNKLCVNPEHLYAGTASDNLNDAYRRGLKKPKLGQTNGNAKLTDAQVAEIMRGTGSQSVEGKKYGVSQAHISWIRKGKRQMAAS